MATVRIVMADFKSVYPSPAYQLGLLAAYASTEPAVRQNVEFQFLEFPQRQPAHEIARELLAAEADLIAASSYSWNVGKIARVLDLLAESGVALPRILLGGPNTPRSFGAQMLQRWPSISALVEGEGEPAFKDICSSLAASPSEDPFAGSRNCVFRDGGGEIVRPDLGHRIRFLDEIPSPYLEGILPVQPSPVFYETNRGCPYRCTFCYWGSGNAKIHRMSHERIREEMEFFARDRVAYLWLADANFGIFKDDSEIAEMMAAINAKHGYPIRFVGVNWAKNSSDRVLEIASILRRGRMETATTLALQSVTPEAEELAKRYAIPPARFAALVGAGIEQGIDTYTDLIWGLPGETVDEFLFGLEAVSLSGIPSIKTHQLCLLPGTEFYDRRRELGLTMHWETAPGAASRRGWFEPNGSIVVRHPKMGSKELRRGRRLMAISHLFHNHDLGRVVNCYLVRYGLTHRQVYDFFDHLLRERPVEPPPPGGDFLAEVRLLVREFASRVDRDEGRFFRELSEAVWIGAAASGREARTEEVRGFLQWFFPALCRRHGVDLEPWELELLRDLVDYNVLISPKPCWRPRSSYRFAHDVDAIRRRIDEALHPRAPLGRTGTGRRRDGEDWRGHAREVRRRLAASLPADFLAECRVPTTYVVTNPWQIAPHMDNLEWLVSSGSRHCVVSKRPAGSARRPRRSAAEAALAGGD